MDIAAANVVIGEVSTRQGAICLPMVADDQRCELWHTDGLKSNSAGHRMIAERFAALINSRVDRFRVPPASTIDRRDISRRFAG
ncbi:hypothetical protein [Rhodococcus sp. 27YEA15]|uniref:hypothetical protein n=1 Tax=Rhodococcus sp. 27YEA15 TaxID=3156259 RepID=UPI003C7DA6C2